MMDIDALAQEIRRVDGNHSLGAGQLAEALAPFIRALSTPIAAGSGEATLASVAQQTIAAIALATHRGAAGELTSDDFAVAAHGSLLWRAWVDAGIVLAALSPCLDGAGDRQVDNLRKIADASRRADGSDIPLGEEVRRAADTIERLRASLARKNTGEAEPVAVRVKYKNEGAEWQYLSLPLHEMAAAWVYSGSWTIEPLFASLPSDTEEKGIGR